MMRVCLGSFMRFLRVVLFALAFSAASVSLGPHPDAAAQGVQYSSLSGVWQGVYWGAGNRATLFQATLQHSGAHVSGSIVETNNLSNEQVPFLLATFEGSANGGEVAFVKTYDGTGGESHSVSYSGHLLSGGRRILGNWTVGATSGQFEMAR
jgi:hypothetical protein